MTLPPFHSNCLERTRFTTEGESVVCVYSFVFEIKEFYRGLPLLLLIKEGLLEGGTSLYRGLVFLAELHFHRVLLTNSGSCSVKLVDLRLRRNTGFDPWLLSAGPDNFRVSSGGAKSLGDFLIRGWDGASTSVHACHAISFCTGYLPCCEFRHYSSAMKSDSVSSQVFDSEFFNFVCSVFCNPV